jgi:glyoxylate/hydroxypyruvate reductase
MQNDSIYIYTYFETPEKQLLKNQLEEKFEVIFHDEIPKDQQFEFFAKCKYCLGNIPLDWCKKTENLQWLQLHSAGIDPYNQLSEAKFPITNLRGFFAESVAETTLAGVLAFYRGYNQLTTLQNNKKWVGNVIRPTLEILHRKNVWVLGGGSIAYRFIDLIKPFDCKIEQSSLSELKLNAHSLEYFEKRAENADLLVLILPEIPETIHYLNKENLSKINAKTLIVNVGRGSSIEEQELKQLLANGKIKGAVLDVTELEPITVSDSLWEMPNVILTQHSAGGWDGESRGKVDFFLKQLDNLLNNKPLENIVDCERGY